jgi:threonine aldolase
VNAAAASGQTLAQACEGFDTVSICFSKGLGAPVGSVLVGSRALIDKAYRWRKVLGGGMRQAGYLAAACLYALEHHWDRVQDDHANAARLAAGLAEIAQVKVTAQSTNMVFAQLPQEHCTALQAYLQERGILTQMLYATRFVTHLDVTQQDIDRVIDEAKQFFAKV